jgi:hypothetical protein
MKRLITLTVVAVLGVGALANVRGADQSRTQQAVLVHFDYGSRDLTPFFQFEDRLEQAIKASGAGEYDGNELAIDGSDGTLYMYGPDADKLFAVVKPLLQSSQLLKNVVVTLRYGAVGDKTAREVKFVLAPNNRWSGP